MKRRHPTDSKRWKVVILLLGLVAAIAGEPERVEPVLYLPPEGAAYAPVPNRVPETTMHWQGEMAGEVTQTSVILQARLTVDGRVRGGDVRGRPGVGAFALSTAEDFRDAFRTRWMAASADGDYMVKTRVTGLAPGTRYYYRLLSGPGADFAEAGPTGTFRTLDPEGVAQEVSFVIVTGMNRFAFRSNALKDAAFVDRSLGFPGLATIAAHEPDFFVATGDNVYYDCPYVGRAKTRESMRAKWHRQFATPRFAALFRRVPTYWEKDDHDFRYNDADPYGDLEPSAQLGVDMFLEQVPVVDPRDGEPVTYRTHRINDLLQIWLVEGRDYRDANTEPPGPDKSLWGAEQKAWLRRTLLESDATFKLLISPTPMVGPDDRRTGSQGGFIAPLFGGAPVGQGEDRRKRDNHTNAHGFRDEGQAFFDWLLENGLPDKGFAIICGDRHWQYHSIHPDGADRRHPSNGPRLEEFSTGALVDGNARLGRAPGDDLSTDPDGLIFQPYLQPEKSGGFLEVSVRPPRGGDPAVARFAFYDERGTLLYSVERRARQ